ncbi:MAG: DNA polymerase IV [Bacillota bacterium]|nr:DNA polymerase IV [Bacillota bacterium]
MDRVILHADLNSFYASVECLYNPDIREKPVAVCGSEELRHGIVLAKNKHAQKDGVKTGDTIWQAKQKSPDLIVITPNFERYMYFSKAARSIYERYTDKVENFGLDECWLDVTGSRLLFGSGEEIAEDIRNTIKNELGITVSVGISWNKIFAKLGSDLKKPDTCTLISKDNYQSVVWPLNASDLLYVGRSTKQKLYRHGLFTIGDIANADTYFLKNLLGKWGETLWAFANGYDPTLVQSSDSSSIIKSIGNSMTTPRDIEKEDDALKVITALSESVAKRLRENNLYCRTVQISLRNTDLAYEEHQVKLNSTFISNEIAMAALKILKLNYTWEKPLRSLGVRACDLIGVGSCFQLDLYGSDIKREKYEQLEFALDSIRSRFGSGSVRKAVLLYDELTGSDNAITHDIHPVSYMR